MARTERRPAVSLAAWGCPRRHPVDRADSSKKTGDGSSNTAPSRGLTMLEIEQRSLQAERTTLGIEQSARFAGWCGLVNGCHQNVRQLCLATIGVPRGDMHRLADPSRLPGCSRAGVRWGRGIYRLRLRAVS